jgi:hypothetical protein
LNSTEDRGVDAVIQSDTFEDDSSMIPFSCTIFSDVMVEAAGNRLSRSLPHDFSSRLSIYFQNVNRLRTKTSDLFKAVLGNDYDVIFLLETSWVSSFRDEELFDSRYSIFRCDRSLSTSNNKSGWGVLIAVKRIFDVSGLSTKNVSLVEHECVKIKCEYFSLYLVGS